MSMFFVKSSIVISSPLIILLLSENSEVKEVEIEIVPQKNIIYNLERCGISNYSLKRIYKNFPPSSNLLF